MDAPATADQVLITSVPEKLPEDIRALGDAHVPIPAQVKFFEVRHTTASVVKSWLIGGGLILTGGLIALCGLAYLAQTSGQVGVSGDFKLIFVGATFIFAGVLVIKSIPRKLTLARAQQSGRQTRDGIFLTPGQLISRSDFDVTVIPRAAFRGLKGVAVEYDLKGVTKSFNLPSELVGKSVEEMLAAVQEWASG